MTVNQRAGELLKKLSLSESERNLYTKAIEKMTESEIESAIRDLEESLAEGPKILETVRAVLENRKNRS